MVSSGPMATNQATSVMNYLLVKLGLWCCMLASDLFLTAYVNPTVLRQINLTLIAKSDIFLKEYI